jgi:phosphate/phosphite/phosphonate ABC transporter binding protein
LIRRSHSSIVHVSFGIPANAAPQAASGALAHFARELEQRVGVPVVPAQAESYDQLAAMMAAGKVQVAWLPPIPFLALERSKLVVPLVSHKRGGRASFEAVLVARADASARTLMSLKGKRAAWVEPLSAAGYVIPRIQLAALGIDPRTTFSSEQFYGSHEAAVSAVLAATADVAATYASVDAEGEVTRGSWSELAGAQGVVKVWQRFGPIPADVTAARSTLDPSLTGALRQALIDVSRDPHGTKLVHAVFGVDEFAAWEETSYETLRKAMSAAAERGLLDVE